MAKNIIGKENEDGKEKENNEYGFDQNEFEQHAMIAYKAREKSRRLEGKIPNRDDRQRMHRQRPTFKQRVTRYVLRKSVITHVYLIG